MAIIKCPECGKKVSDQSQCCIHCGFPFNHISEPDNSAVESPPLSSLSGTIDTAGDNKAELSVSADESDLSFVQNRRRKISFYLSGAAVVVLLSFGLLFYFFYYRVHFVAKEVVDFPYTVCIDKSDTNCTISGTLLDGIPQGSAAYSFLNGNSVWSFNGSLNDSNEIFNGVATNMPIVIKTNAGSYQTIYTGSIQNGKIADLVKVSDMPYSASFDGVEYTGLYTGNVTGALPNGTGSFICEKDTLYFKYQGDWSNGVISGSGTLESNDVTVHFPEVDRKGTYQGDVVDGVFSGHGIFSATTDDGINYTYDGNWSDGQLDGEGAQIYDDRDSYNHIGNFQNSVFAPSVYDFFVSFGTKKTAAYTVSDNASSFLKNHESLFTLFNKDLAEPYIDATFSYAQFAKNPNKFGSMLFKIKLSVFQVFEYEDFWGYPATYFLATDRSYNVYYGLLLNTSDKLVDGKSITLYALPLSFATYEGVDGNDHWALRFAAVYVE